MGARRLGGLSALCAAVLITTARVPIECPGHDHTRQLDTVAVAVSRPVGPVVEQIVARRGQLAGQGTPASQHVAPRCDDSQPRGNGNPYDGAVSALYDQVFHPSGPPIPYLDSYVPQSLLPWANWDGAGHDLVLLGMYRTGAPSYLVGLDSRTGQAIGTVAVHPSHLGGMAFLGSWLFAGDNPWPHAGSPTVRRYRIAAVREAMQEAVETDEPVWADSDGPEDPIEATDFMTVDGDSMYTGNHGNAGVPGLMYRYVLGSGGHLQRVEGPWRIPLRAQGMVLTPQDFLFSSDNGAGARGELNVVRRASPTQLGDPIACVWIPAMPEDMALQNGRLLLVFEGGAQRYSHDHPANRIDNVHAGTLATLLTLTDPPAAPASPPTAPAAPAPVSGSRAAQAPAAPAASAPAASAPTASAPAASTPAPGSRAAQAPVAPATPASAAPASAAPASDPAAPSTRPVGSRSVWS
ncbi:MAG TPA: hypothetical protein VHV82_06300 [Sporichthyaceae bacterium]|nr:hypothetical protein [Sporichthyaceae bacterium]